jgi:hypothetical protein
MDGEDSGIWHRPVVEQPDEPASAQVLTDQEGRQGGDAAAPDRREPHQPLEGRGQGGELIVVHEELFELLQFPWGTRRRSGLRAHQRLS